MAGRGWGGEEARFEGGQPRLLPGAPPPRVSPLGSSRAQETRRRLAPRGRRRVPVAMVPRAGVSAQSRCGEA